MELSYIWVREYNILKEFEVNFNHSGRHKFAYKNGKLSERSNDESFLDFGSKISSVTAIAGQNGSGKSSLCEIIIRSMATLTEGSLGYSFIFEGIVCFGKFLFYHKSVVLKNKESLKKLGYEVIEFENTPLEPILGRLETKINNTGFLYFANVIDWRTAIDEVNLYNISTQALIESDVHYGPYFPYYSITNIPLTEQFGKKRTRPLSAHHYEEYFRQVNFYLNFPEFIPFEGPARLSLRILNHAESPWLSIERSKSPNAGYYSIGYEIVNDISGSVDIGEGKMFVIDRERCESLILRYYRFNLFLGLINASRTVGPDLDVARKMIYSEDYDDIFFANKKGLLSEVVGVFAKILNRSALYLEFKPRDLMLSYQEQDWRLTTISHLSVQNDTENRGLLKMLNSLEQRLMEYHFGSFRRICNYQMYPPLSSGQSSFLSLFSRIYHSILIFQSSYEDRKQVVLLIDEGDIAFHPAWKRKLIDWLVTFLNMSFNDFTFQIIISSHSPFLLSDLTSENILLMKREKGRSVIIPQTEFRTFGGNIHELLSESFFLDDGLIGEFATRKIEEFANMLQSREGDVSIDENSSKNFIDAVADDIIRGRLYDLWMDRFHKPYPSLQAELAVLESQVKQIKQRLKR